MDTRYRDTVDTIDTWILDTWILDTWILETGILQIHGY